MFRHSGGGRLETADLGAVRLYQCRRCGARYTVFVDGARIEVDIEGVDADEVAKVGKETISKLWDRPDDYRRYRGSNYRSTSSFHQDVGSLADTIMSKENMDRTLAPTQQQETISKTTTPTYDTATIRKVLTAAFSSDDLETFCFDHFRTVYDQTGGMSHPQRIQRLIEHCERYSEFDRLLQLIQEINPVQYDKFLPKLFNRRSID